MEIFTSLLSNLGLLGLALIGVFLISVNANLPDTGRRYAVVQGVIYGLASALVVSFPIHGPSGELFDTRAAPILVAGFFGGPLTGMIAATIGAIDRFIIGGPLAWGGVTTFYLYLAAALVWRRYFDPRFLTLMQGIGLATLASVFVIPAFFTRPSFENSLTVLQDYWLIVLIGNTIGTVMMGLVVTQILSFTNRQKEHQAIIASSADGIITVNARLRITAVNPAAEGMFGWRREQLLGRRINCLIPTEFEKGHNEKASAFLNQQDVSSRLMTENRAIQALRADGTTFPAHIALAKFINAGETKIVATVHDMTEVQEARNKLGEMTETLALKLRESMVANESKNMFLANMSHELRTPLNAIIGFSSLILTFGAANLKKAKVDEYVSDIKHSGETLLAMINDVLDISKIESGATEIVLEPISTKTIVDDVILLAKVNAAEKQVRLHPSGNLDSVIACDIRTMKQALLNLVTNAIKFSPAGGTVRIRVSAKADTVHLCVEDDGEGIPDFVIERLGEPFLRGDTRNERNIEGTGLGLALSKKFVERQNGKLSLEKRREGGTIATITMPLEPTASIATADKPLVSA